MNWFISNFISRCRLQICLTDCQAWFFSLTYFYPTNEWFCFQRYELGFCLHILIMFTFLLTNYQDCKQKSLIPSNHRIMYHRFNFCCFIALKFISQIQFLIRENQTFTNMLNFHYVRYNIHFLYLRSNIYNEKG